MLWTGKVVVSLHRKTTTLPSCQAGSAPQPADGRARHSAQRCTHTRRNHCGNKQLLLAVSYTGKVIRKPQSISRCFCSVLSAGVSGLSCTERCEVQDRAPGAFSALPVFWKSWKYILSNPKLIFHFYFPQIKVWKSPSIKVKLLQKKERALNISKPRYISGSLLFFRFWEGPGMCLSTKSTWWHQWKFNRHLSVAEPASFSGKAHN